MADQKKPAQASDSTFSSLPVVVRDPRFKAGRALIGKEGEESINVFATLLEEAQAKYGDSHIEAAPAYYEYGNALFRVAQRRSDANETDEGGSSETKARAAAREAAAAAAERRAKRNDNDNDGERKTPAKGNGVDDQETSSEKNKQDDDILLALEMMENAWSILDEHQQQKPTGGIYSAWLNDQVPRVLTGIGDVLSALNRHPDAADTYLRALEHRQNILLENIEKSRSSGSDDDKICLLQCRRKVVEVNILIAEELLACPQDQDVVTTETETVLVKAGEVVEYARGYYDKARDELQEAVLLLGQLAAEHIDVGEEKENICFVATMVMGVGETLAQKDDEELRAQQREPVKKKGKKS